MRITEAISTYLDNLQAEGRSPRTIDAYRRDLALLADHLGPERDVATIRPPDLLAFAASPAVRDLRDGAGLRHPTSVNRTRSAVRGLFDFLVRAWVIPQSPALVLRVKAAAPPPTTLLAPAEERALHEAIASDPSWEACRDGLMVRLMIATGLRVSSVVALNAGDLDLAHLRITAPTKGGRRITVAVERTLLAALLGLAVGREGALFTSKVGGRLTVRQVQVRLHRWVELAALRSHVTPHALRHTFGTRLYAETKDLRRVQVAMGHRSVTTTERYVAVG